MKLQSVLFKTTMIVVLFPTSFVTFAQDQQLSLKHGVYVQETAACKSAPNAAILQWDGVGFSDAHASKCTSRVLHQAGSHFQVRTTCSAFGDGSPDPAGAGYVDSIELNRLSSLRFEMVTKSQVKSTFRWCSAKDVD